MVLYNWTGVAGRQNRADAVQMTIAQVIALDKDSRLLSVCGI